MLNYFEEKKETFFDYKKQNFSKFKKSHFSMLLAKKCHFLYYLNLIKISLEIMLSDFGEKKEIFFD